MSGIVNVRHPALLTYLTRGRTEKSLLVETRTPIRLVEESPSAFALAGVLASGDSVHVHDGRLWVLQGHHSPIPLHDYLWFLEGKGAPRAVLDLAFIGTPVRARNAISDPRGNTFDATQARRILHDGTAEASGALQGWFGRNVRVAGGRMFFACDLLAANGNLPGDYASLPLPASGIGRFPVSTFARVDGLWEHEDRQAGRKLSEYRRVNRKVFLKAHAGIPHELVPEDADIRAVTNYLARRSLSLLNEALGTRGFTKDVFDDVRAARAPLWPHAYKAVTGMLGSESFEDILNLTKKAYDVLRCFDQHIAVGELRPQMEYADKVLLPRVHAPPANGDDADALAGLVPGGL